MAYPDADLGNERDDRWSVTGFVLQIEGCAYAYTIHIVLRVNYYTCCSEFVSAAEFITMIMYTHNTCKELVLVAKESFYMKIIKRR